MITPATLPPRVAMAILSASHTNVALQCSAIAKPISRLEYRSITVATYNLASHVTTSVMSPHQVRFTADATGAYVLEHQDWSGARLVRYRLGG